MKVGHNLLLFIAFSALLSFSSCTSYYIDSAQPIDVENIYSLPKRITGSWYIKESPDDSLADWDSISITKAYYHYVVRDNHKGTMSEIEADSTVFIVDNKIYLQEDGAITAVFPFIMQDDSVVVSLVDHELVEFGPKAFLREIDYGYILNTQHDKLWGWWDLKFIDLRSKSQIVVRGLSDSDLQRLPAYKTLNEEYKNYLQAKWTSSEILGFIDKGGFSDTLITLLYNERLQN